MKFMLIMNCPRNAYEMFGSMPKEVTRAHIQYMKETDVWLRGAGELVYEAGLADPREAQCVRAGADGRAVTSGEFAVGKEYLAGYWVVEVASAERAYEIAARISAAPGPGGPMNMPVEVRQVMSGPPEEFL